MPSVQCTEIKAVTTGVACALHTLEAFCFLLESGLGINAGAVLIRPPNDGTVPVF